MDVLITGATGFVGRHLVERLLCEGNRVKALVRPETDASRLDALGVEVVRGDVRNSHAVELVAENCQLIYHLAARTSHGNPSAKDTYPVNVEGTANVVRAALQAGVSRLVLASTTGVYGPIKNRAIDERTPVKPYSAYTKSKDQAERLVLSHHARHGLPVVIARITSVFGPGYKSWLGLFQAITAGRFRLIGSGNNYRHPAEVSDIVEGLFLCGTVRGIEGRTYILAGNEPLLLRDMIRLIQDELGAPALRRAFPAMPLRLYELLDEAFRACGGEQLPRFDRVRFFLTDEIFDQSRARAELGYTPRVSLKEAIHRTAEWYREQGYLSS